MIQRSDVTAVVGITLLVGVVVGAVVTGALTVATDGGADPETNDPEPTAPVTIGTSGDGVTTFGTAEEYRAYFERDARNSLASSTPPGARTDVAVERDAGDAVTEDATAATDGGGAADGGAADGGGGFDGGDATTDSSTSGGAERHSETNVQVEGVDEPDLLKTDGEWVYYAGTDWRRHTPDGDTDVLDARTPSTPERTTTIPTGGQLLRSGDTLVTIERDTVSGYDVSDPTDPEERWHRTLNHSVETARLANGTLYLVLQDRPRGEQPCPIRPFDASGSEVPAVDQATSEIACTDVYRPAGSAGGDATYTAMAIDPESGAVGDQVSFAGGASNTVVYVSHDAIYLTYEDSPSRIETRLAFLEGPASEHLDQQTLDRLETVQEYDLSEEALRAEIRATLQRQRERLSPDERADLEEALSEEWEAYVEAHKRELLRTGVVRIDAEDDRLAVDGTGEVPGRVEDQFALSERGGHLHVATTVNPRGAEWENDLYTLDDDLEVADSVTGLGVGQRIYSVRYVEDRAYLVTFRQVDPFYVIDVSDPTALEQLGKLKLPGYSDYMHPLETDRILGIGEEEGRVKATVFDAGDPENPVVEDDLQLSDHSTAISRTHHGFLLDERHEVFFLPGSDAGHVVSYEDGLERVATVETAGPALRALYVDDYLYVFGPEELVVLDQTDWSEVHRTEL